MKNEKTIRCAIYTRKSTDEGLEKEFNTLEAQREACEAFIKSRIYEGWETIPVHYDDGGFSGGNINRPALKRLMADIELGKVDMIVVYKIDRLSRNLSDFSKMIDVLDKHECSFVSVTQQFNTADSTGRLMLNVLLSFAQFEREIGSERIRDKVAASKQKGMWMGGVVPLGYDLINKKLVINETEAETIRFIFEHYLIERSERKVIALANQKGHIMKIRKNKNGDESGGKQFDLSSLNAILRNPLYAGKIPHKGKMYDGQHEAIINYEDWQKVQRIKKLNIRNRFGPASETKNNILKGMLECECCQGSMVSTTSKKANKYYDYYTSIQAIKSGYKTCSLGSVPAGELELFVIRKVQELFKSPQVVKELAKKVQEQYPDYGEPEIWKFMQSIDKVFKYFSPATISSIIKQVIEKIIVSERSIIIRYNPFGISLLSDTEKTREKGFNPNYLEFTYPAFIKKNKGRSVIIEEGKFDTAQERIDFALLNTIKQGFKWAQEMQNKKMKIFEFAHFKRIDRSYLSRTLKVRNLAPDIIEAIMKGAQPRNLKIEDITRKTMPCLWEEQRKLYGFLD